MKLKVRFKKLKENAVIPRYNYESDAGMDFFAIGDGEIFPQSTKTVSTGIAWEPVVENYKTLLKIEGRSGLGSMGIDVFAGTVDESFRGELKIVLYNSTNKVWKYKEGDKIAQGIIYRLPMIIIEEVDELSDTERGSKGFGSSDKK